jgi:hypothetical protein
MLSINDKGAMHIKSHQNFLLNQLEVHACAKLSSGIYMLYDQRYSKELAD